MRRIFVGLDEAGRGPVAGPVAVAAIVVAPKFKNQLLKKKTQVPLRDSKKLSRKQRELWFAHLTQLKKKKKINFSVSLVGAPTIDRIGIVRAIKRALSRTVNRIGVPKRSRLLLDGSLIANKKYINQRTIIRGDEKIPIIMLASIIAKVRRDRYMYTMAKKYPEYDFHEHVGYGTKKHYKKIQKYGLSALHRSSFLKSRINT
jgi:ribonuclease HII